MSYKKPTIKVDVTAHLPMTVPSNDQRDTAPIQTSIWIRHEDGKLQIEGMRGTCTLDDLEEVVTLLRRTVGSTKPITRGAGDGPEDMPPGRVWQGRE